METNASIAVLALPLVAPSDCARIAAELGAARWYPGQVDDPDGPGGEVRASTRRCRLTPEIDKRIVDSLIIEVKRANLRVHGFDLDGVAPDDPVLAMRYAPGDHFAWHIDNALATRPSETRKLSFSLQLSAPTDYDGGDLELAALSFGRGEAEAAAMRASLRQQGTLVVFPSFHLHRVTPITRGERLAIVGWLHGPAFA